MVAVSTLLRLLLLAAAFAVGAGQVVRTVSPGESLAAAVDSASPGDIISLSAGLHTVTEEIVVTKNLTIRGVDTGASIISPTQSVVKLLSFVGLRRETGLLANLTVRGDTFDSEVTPRFLIVAVDMTLRLDGVVVEGGSAPLRISGSRFEMTNSVVQNIRNLFDVGGCMQLTQSTTFSIRDSKFANCFSTSDAGCIFNAASGEFINTTFDSCVSEDDGAALLFEGNTFTTGTFINCVFRNNQAAGDGGAFYTRSGPSRKDVTVLVEGCTFDNNTSLEGADSVLSTQYRSITVRDSTFTNNLGLYMVRSGRGGALVTLERNVFRDNSVTDAVLGITGALDMRNCEIANSERAVVLGFFGPMDVSIQDCRFSGMRQEEGGGSVIRVDGFAAGTVDVGNCVFEDSSSVGDGGMFALSTATKFRFHDCKVKGASSDGCGGAFALGPVQLEVDNCKFEDVSAAFGGFMCFQDDCSGVSLSDTEITSASARIGGGLYYHNANTTLCSARKCSGCSIKSPSAKGYGDNAATRPVDVSVRVSTDTTCKDETFDVCAVLQDAFGQEARGFSGLSMSLHMQFLGVDPVEPGKLPDPSENGAFSVLTDTLQEVEDGQVCFKGVTLLGPEESDVEVQVTVIDSTDSTVLFGNNKETILFDYCEDFIKWGSAYAIVLIVLAALTILFLLITVVIILLNKESRYVRALSWTMIMLAYVGVLMVLAAALLLIGEPTDSVCIAIPILGGLGYCLAVSAICFRLLRIYTIFRAAKSLKTINVSDFYVMRGVVAMLVPEVIILVVWMAVDTPEVVGYACDGPHIAILVVFIVYNAIVLVPGLVLAWLVRKYPRIYNDSQWIGYGIYSCVLFIVPGLIIVLAADLSNEDTNFVAALLLIVGSFMLVALVVLPRLIMAKFVKEEETTQYSAGGTHNTTS